MHLINILTTIWIKKFLRRKRWDQWRRSHMVKMFWWQKVQKLYWAGSNHKSWQSMLIKRWKIMKMIWIIIGKMISSKRRKTWHQEHNSKNRQNNQWLSLIKLVHIQGKDWNHVLTVIRSIKVPSISWIMMVRKARKILEMLFGCCHIRCRKILGKRNLFRPHISLILRLKRKNSLKNLNKLQKKLKNSRKVLRKIKGEQNLTP